MIVFGITGGSGCGKTSVSSVFAELGVKIIDTDVIAHEVVEPESLCLKELSEYFGTEILNNDGTLDRKKLASIAFSTADKIAMLNKITHKYIKERVISEIERSDAELAAIDGAVIIGSNIEQLCEFIVSVIADVKVRTMRIIKRDNISECQAKQRIAAQPDDEFYKKHSKYIIRNEGDMADLRNNVIKVYEDIKGV